MDLVSGMLIGAASRAPQWASRESWRVALQLREWGASQLRGKNSLSTTCEGQGAEERPERDRWVVGAEKADHWGDGRGRQVPPLVPSQGNKKQL